MSGAETAWHRVVQRRIGSAKTAAPNRQRRNGVAEMALPHKLDIHECDGSIFMQINKFPLPVEVNMI